MLVASALDAPKLDAPTGGNPRGDLVVQAFLDYNCPYCKKAEPDLRAFLAADGHTRLVYRDWPILSEASQYGARLALAAAVLGRYEEVHRALMAIPERSSHAAIDAAVRRIGLAPPDLENEAMRHADAIAALLSQNADAALANGFKGVPAFLFGSIKVGAGFYKENFEAFAARARRAHSETAL